MLDGSKLSLLTVGATIVVLPLAMACGPATVGGSLEDTNARVAYLVTEDNGTDEADFTDAAVTAGRDSATLSADGTTADFTTPTDDIHNQKNLARNPHHHGELYGDSQSGSGGITYNTIEVVRLTDIDGDGTPDDTFLTYHRHNPNSASRTEFSRGYHGTRSPTSVMDELRSRSGHTAVYSGHAEIEGAQGSNSLFLHGDLTMTTQFSGSSSQINGDIAITTPSGMYNPGGIDQMTFGGDLISDSADYDISNIRLRRQGSDYVTMEKEAGVGSFFGPHAGGTIGVFSGSGQTNDSSPSRVNIIGSFHGSTTDNNP